MLIPDVLYLQIKEVRFWCPMIPFAFLHRTRDCTAATKGTWETRHEWRVENLN